MKRTTWLRISVPIMAFLILWQPITGLNAERLGEELFEALHVGGGILLVVLVLFHIVANWTWVKNNYFKKSN